MSHKMLPRVRLDHDMERFSKTEQYTKRLENDLKNLRRTTKSIVLTMFSWKTPFICNKNYIRNCHKCS